LKQLLVLFFEKSITFSLSDFYVIISSSSTVVVVVVVVAAAATERAVLKFA
jgi:hypothetical protein